MIKFSLILLYLTLIIECRFIYPNFQYYGNYHKLRHFRQYYSFNKPPAYFNPFHNDQEFHSQCPEESIKCFYPMNYRAIFECSYDSECPENYKCCPDSCFQHKVCKEIDTRRTIVTRRTTKPIQTTEITTEKFTESGEISETTIETEKTEPVSTIETSYETEKKTTAENEVTTLEITTETVEETTGIISEITDTTTKITEIEVTTEAATTETATEKRATAETISGNTTLINRITTERGDTETTITETESTLITTDEQSEPEITPETTVITTEEQPTLETTPETTVITTEKQPAAGTTPETPVNTTEEQPVLETTPETTVITTEEQTAPETPLITTTEKQPPETEIIEASGSGDGTIDDDDDDKDNITEIPVPAEIRRITTISETSGNSDDIEFDDTINDNRVELINKPTESDKSNKTEVITDITEGNRKEIDTDDEDIAEIGSGQIQHELNEEKSKNNPISKRNLQIKLEENRGGYRKEVDEDNEANLEDYFNYDYEIFD